MQLKSLLFLVFLSVLLVSVGCTYSQLSSIKFHMKHDIENKVTIEWASINRLNLYRTSKEVATLNEGKKKWVFSNSDGCVVVYITYTDSDGDSIVSDAYISSGETKCEKRLRYSHHP